MSEKFKKLNFYYLKKIKELEETEHNPEANHAKADELLCELLNKLGFEDITKAFEEMDKWYS